MDIAKIDKNFDVSADFDTSDLEYFDIEEAPFRIFGIEKSNGKFRRMPEDIAKNVNEGVFFLHTNTAGGRVCFETDSPKVAINVKMPYIGKMPHFAFTGSIGFDLYECDEEPHYLASFVPEINIENHLHKIVHFESRKTRKIIINFPLYSDVEKMYIAVEKGSALKEFNPYSNKPVVFYGSSITQGACAARPGNSYQAILSRKFGFDYINLGFSGNARAEDAMADYIASLDMSAFVYDYDHNSPSLEHFKSTHKRFLDIIRKKHPNLPIIMLSRPNQVNMSGHYSERIKIILDTLNNFKAKGDNNIYFVSGQDILNSYDKDIVLVDGCHPNDFGFYCMAKMLEPIFREIF